ncbi:hypothetical protein BRM55_00040, partial [Xanthomonas oryzae pv. oryzae]|uniref:hypothetical protein n=1 Tax=Xanthomonas oryzae TaxID=347 RepID=UPI000E1323C1
QLFPTFVFRFKYIETTQFLRVSTRQSQPISIKMQFRLVAVTLAVFAAGVSAQNSTTGNGTQTGLPQPTPTENAAWSNAVSMGGLALAVAGVVAAAF